MKRNRILTYIIAGIVMLGSFTACDDYLDVNTDPNNPTAVSPALTLPVAQVYTATLMHNQGRVNALGNMMMYNWSESQGFSWYDEEFQYLVTTTFYSAIFDYTYRDALKQYQELTYYGEGFENYEAIGLIMKAYHFQILVDMYGDIPYTQALQRSENIAPEYDDAAVVYDSLVASLTTAVELINGPGSDPVAAAPSADDFMFGGDMMMWKQLAHSIKLRLLTRISDMASKQQYITDELAVIAAEGSGYLGENAIVAPSYEVATGKQNPYWESLGFAANGAPQLNYQATCASQFIIDKLTSDLDPRISFLYEEPATGHLGVDQGLEPGPEFAPEFVSNIGPGILKSATMGSIIFTEAETLFNLAELAQKGFGGDAQTYYEAGITASFESLSHDAASLTSADAAAYYGQNRENVGWDASTDKMEAIITQKWIAVNGVTAEQSWFDYSRTGYPSGLPVSAQASTADRPVRLFYTSIEQSSNPNVPGDQPDAFTDKIFWAQ